MILANGTTRLQPGDRVMFDRKYPGTVRYHGKVHFSPNVWIGVELDEQMGKNDGSVGGKRYFKCRSEHGIFAPPSRFAKRPDLELGCKVVLKQMHLGIVRYIGTSEFGAGEWIGIELKEAVGKHDGFVKGKRYFTCKPSHGIFARSHHVTRAISGIPDAVDNSRPLRRYSSSSREEPSLYESQNVSQILEELSSVKAENVTLKREIQELKLIVSKAEQLSLSENISFIQPGNMVDPTEEEIQRRSSPLKSQQSKAEASEHELNCDANSHPPVQKSDIIIENDSTADRITTGNHDFSVEYQAAENGLYQRLTESPPSRNASQEKSLSPENHSANKESKLIDVNESTEQENGINTQVADHTTLVGHDDKRSAHSLEDKKQRAEKESILDGRISNCSSDNAEDLEERIQEQDIEINYLKRQVAFERAKMSELAKLLDMAKKSLVEGARRENEHKRRLTTTERKLEKVHMMIDDLAIHGDAIEAELEEALQDKQNLSDRLAEIQMELLDAKTEQFTAMTECEMMRQDLQQLREQVQPMEHVELVVENGSSCVDDPVSDINVASVDTLHFLDRTEESCIEKDATQSTTVPTSQIKSQNETGHEAGVVQQNTSGDQAKFPSALPSDIPDTHNVSVTTYKANVNVDATSNNFSSNEHDDMREDNDAEEAAFIDRPTPPPGVDPSMFCTICEEYGHLAEDCDDTITF